MNLYAKPKNVRKQQMNESNVSQAPKSFDNFQPHLYGPFTQSFQYPANTQKSNEKQFNTKSSLINFGPLQSNSMGAHFGSAKQSTDDLINREQHDLIWNNHTAQKIIPQTPEQFESSKGETNMNSMSPDKDSEHFETNYKNINNTDSKFHSRQKGNL